MENPSSAPQEIVPDLSLSLEAYQLQFQLGCLNSQLGHLNDNHNLRLEYTGKIYWLVALWLAGVVTCIALSGFGAKGFKLSDNVLIAFITSTTINVVGLFVLVAKWMYPTSSRSDSAEALRAQADGMGMKINSAAASD